MGVSEFSLGWIWLAGVVSFLSPCVVPILPGYVAYLAGHAAGCDPAKVERWRVLVHGAAFVLGFSLMFIALGATASAAGRLLIGYRDWIARIGGVLMVVFGLQMTGVIHLPFLEYGTRPNVQPNPRWGLASSVVVGFAFATGWTPCIGLVLGSVLTLAAYEASLGRGMMMLAVYAAGLAVPFLIVALLMDRMGRWICRLAKIARYISIAAGILMIGFGILFAAGELSFLAGILPGWEIGL
ncbi:MAG: cytochrome c biogenesis protein CcdA [Anaerolineales bacterium]